ncbi:MAG: hypothetical protein ACE5GI_02070 [Candidatus Aminicenantales bacterium]
MRKFTLVYLGFMFIIGFMFIVFTAAVREENPIKVEAWITPKRLYRGQSGKVTLKIRVKKGLAVSPQPSFIIEFSPSQEVILPKNFFTASDLEIKTLEKNGEEYLDFKDPIEIPFTISLEAKRGNHLLEGKIKYFACSLQEAWCLKSSANFKASFYTRRTAIKKKSKS